MEETSIRLHGDFGCELGSALKGGVMSALALKSQVPEEILHLVGMSGRLYRRTVNEIVRRLNDARYLEIGSWAGSTAASALFANTVTATCIDNWSEFANHAGVGSPYESFKEATSKALSGKSSLNVIESDFRKVDYSKIGMFNIYLFDGPHEYHDQYDGITIAQPATDRRYIQIVDDWNWPQVRDGTFNALNEIGKIVCSVEVKTTQDDSHPQRAVMQDSQWHNGYFLAVIEK